MGKEETVGSAFLRILGAKYTVKATPQRVADFAHHLDDVGKNQKFLEFLSKKSYETIYMIDRGELRLYDTAFIFIDGNKNNPIAFGYFFHTESLLGKVVAQEDHIVCLERARDIRIEGLPLGDYCLWKVLLPRYKTLISATQHTLDGEEWFKRQLQEAITKGLHVYQVNSAGVIFDANTREETKIRHMWGDDPEYRKRLFILSLDPLS